MNHKISIRLNNLAIVYRVSNQKNRLNSNQYSRQSAKECYKITEILKWKVQDFSSSRNNIEGPKQYQKTYLKGLNLEKYE